MNQTKQREQALAPLSRRSSHTAPWDMLIIGGGITGAGIAREAARRGLAVLLIEQKDFAWGTSSRSSKMVHGGLRYIASGDYKTTLLSVRERERMLSEAGGLVNEMHFVMPHYKGKFPPPWIFNTLLRVYDRLAGKRYFTYFKKDAFLRLNPHIKQDKFLGASQFSDAVTDDSRLVMRVLDEAINDGAQAINYLKAESLITNEQGLVVGATLKDTASKDSDQTYDVHAKVVVSATGAWADSLRMQASKQTEQTFNKQIDLLLAYLLYKCFQYLDYNQALTKLLVIVSLLMFIQLPFSLWSYVSSGVYEEIWYPLRWNIRVYNSYFFIMSIFAVWFYTTEQRYSYLYLLFLFLTFLSILLDAGRSATLAYTVFIAVVSLCYSRVRWPLLSMYGLSWTAYLSLAYLATLNVISAPEVGSQILRTTTSLRYDLWMNAYQCWSQHPILGCGFYQLEGLTDLAAHPHN